jgi:dienelactone hydrolase
MKNNKVFICLALICLVWLFPIVSVAAVTAERIDVPLNLQGKTLELDAMIYKPAGIGPFPAMIMTHGTSRKVADRQKIAADEYYVKNARTFVDMGLVVLFVVRRGFGVSDGPYSEFNKYPNGGRNYTQDGLEAAKDLGAAVQYLQEQPFVDKTKIVLLGQSTGGHSVLATGSLNLPGVAGVINFAGGRGSTGPDVIRDEANLVESFRTYGKTFRVPTLWLYSENDHYFGPDLAQKFLKAFQADGAKATFISLPALGEDGHSSFLRGQDNWLDEVHDFLQQLGLISQTRVWMERGYAFSSMRICRAATA